MHRQRPRVLPDGAQPAFRQVHHVHLYKASDAGGPRRRCNLPMPKKKPSNRPALVAGGAVALALVAGALAWWLWPVQPPPPPPMVEAPAPLAPAPAPPAPAAAPVIAHPIEAVDAASAPAGPPDLQASLVELFGRQAVRSLFESDDFAHRLAATVDNLGRAQAPTGLWPLKPATGRFSVDTQDGGSRIAADNAARYTPYVLLFENVDLHRLVATYVRLYPQFQQAYKDLGFPRGYFNDRLVEVIDGLLATPDLATPARMRLPEARGPVVPTRPWLLYEFDEASLARLSAGQKILLRMGPVNERRVKIRLTALRGLLTGPGTPR